MTSESDAISKICYTDDKWVLDICENFLPPNEDLQNRDGDGVSVCQVPKWLSSQKPEAFIPQFVGLGPYHHSRPELIMTDKLKLATAKRALNLNHLFDNGETLHQRLKTLVSNSDLQPFYHIDVNSIYNYQTLLYILTVDGLFLLSLLHQGASANSQGHSYFLTGKHDGKAMVNAGGAQLTMDFIIRDVFMLENQIPTYFLKQIAELLPTKSDQIQSHKDLGLAMNNFCQALCPMVHFENLSKSPEAHYHLLDLIYHLIVPELKPEPEPEHVESVPKPKPKPELEPEPKPKPEPGPLDNENSYVVLYFVILFFPVGLVLGIVLGIVKVILKSLLWILKSLFRMVANLAKLIHPVVEAFYDILSKVDDRFSYLKDKHWAEIIGETSEEEDTRPAVTIPSVMELHNVGINFRPSEGSISSIKFDVENCQFHLPVIKLDVNSEIIIRNLMAYESLTRSKELIFTRYVEIMRSIIETPYDVKLLVHQKIIHTYLSDEVVVQLFNGMSTIRPSKTPKLEQVINKVIAKFESTKAVNRLLTKYIYSSWKFITVVGGIIFLLLTFAQTYCSVFECVHTKNTTHT